MKKISLWLAAFLLVFNFSLRADEGMWLLPLLEKLNMGKMTELGLELTAEEIYSINNSSLKDAIVIFGGGCTAEIVSDQGLLLTNHHCGYGIIQSHSSTEHNYLEDGFWAQTKEDELVNQRLSVTFLVRIEDVSDPINSQLNDEMTEEERMEKINEISAEIQNKATEGNHYSARVQSFFGGNNFYLLVYETYRDVRFVGAPPSSIGKYGGDTDNWEWPRHTGDFSVFRVYMSPDGKPAPYAEENIPLKPRHYLPVSAQGVEPGDFAMILGYPGGTQRYMTSWEIDEVLKITHPNRIKIRSARQEIMLADMLADEKVQIQYASKYSGSSNYWKFSIGQSQVLKRLKVKNTKMMIEDEFTSWVAASPDRKEKYGKALEMIQTAVNERAEYVHAAQYLSECILRGSELIAASSGAIRLYEALEEGNEENIQRAAEFIKGRTSDFYKDYNAPTDRKVIKAMLKMFAEDVPVAYQPDFIETIQSKYKGDYNKYVDDMFEKSVFVSEDRLLAFLEAPSKKVLDKDLAFIAARSSFEKNNELREKRNASQEKFNLGHRLFVAGLREMDPSLVQYPDANFTMRLTYGTVGGYDPKDAVHYKYYTTLDGVMEKEDPDNFEFVVEDKLKELYQNKDYGNYGKDGYMPVCFLTNTDITGGNSGSPVINGRGELIGLAFDGNWEAMSGDIAFEPDLQRCIAVDIRYVLFIMDKFAGAKHLVDEMDVVW